jgi:ornithine cyclodeaminase/alanine dehydrogenase-like protein (mu-crystallin family)
VTGSLPPETLILTGADIHRLMTPDDWLAAVETGFRAAATGHADAPPPMTLEGSGGTFHAKGATIQLGKRYVALKLNGNFPDNPRTTGLPTIQGAVLLCDGGTGSLLAVMDSIEVTLRRTAAATALAAKYMARPSSSSILICGCGEQGAAQLAALRSLLPLKRTLAWDRDFSRAEAFADRFGSAGFPVDAVGELPTGDRTCDIIVTATTARTPFLEPRQVSAGAFVAAVGADSPDKSELHPDVMRGACVVADVLAQCAAMGDVRHAIAAGALRLADVHAELSELVTGAKPGRTSDEQVTIFDSTGTALQDVASAAAIYQKAVREPGMRTVAFAR